MILRIICIILFCFHIVYLMTKNTFEFEFLSIKLKLNKKPFYLVFATKKAKIIIKYICILKWNNQANCAFKAEQSGQLRIIYQLKLKERQNLFSYMHIQNKKYRND